MLFSYQYHSLISFKIFGPQRRFSSKVLVNIIFRTLSFFVNISSLKQSKLNFHLLWILCLSFGRCKRPLEFLETILTWHSTDTLSELLAKKWLWSYWDYNSSITSETDLARTSQAVSDTLVNIFFLIMMKVVQHSYFGVPKKLKKR